jgi:polysaccharide export outer membrane protein
MPVSSAVRLDTPVIRVSGQEDPAEETGPITASSWRPAPRPGEQQASFTPKAPSQVTRTVQAEALPLPARAGLPTVTEPPPAPEMHPCPPGKGAHPTLRQKLFHHGNSLTQHAHAPIGGVAPNEGNKALLPPYIIEPSDIILVKLYKDLRDEPQEVDGQYLVGADGTINLGIYGRVRVAGYTFEAARDAIGVQLQKRIRGNPKLDSNQKPTGEYEPLHDLIAVDLIQSNSKFCYVIADGAGYGITVLRVPVTGGDTVLDAVAKSFAGLPPQSSPKKVWLARANAAEGSPKLFPVDWNGITRRAALATNYQVIPGDRIFVNANPLVTLSNRTQQVLQTPQQIAGAALLGSSLYNSITGRFNNGSGNR